MPSSGSKKQLKFGHRRHIAKPRTSLGSMESEKRQSSLTQLDFVSTPQPSSEIIRIPDTDDEDEDFVVEQPKKRRRLSSKNSADDDWTPRANRRSSTRRRSAKIKQEHGREKGQQTMTQMDFVSSAEQHGVEDDIEDDHGCEFNGSEDGNVQGSGHSKHEGRKRTIPWLDRADDMIEDLPASRRTPSPTKGSRRPSPTKVSHQPRDLAFHSISAHDFTTPKKALRHLEVPSSQSPPSVKMSSKRSQRSRQASASPSKLANTPGRSPLKEKSANVAPQRWQPETQESQNPTMKMLQQVRWRTKFGKAPLHEEAPMPPPKRPKSQVLVEASQNVEAPRQMEPSPRKLRRVATIQDSQAEDEAIMTQAPPPKLYRVSTIQNSQVEDLDLSSQIYRSISSRENLADFESQAYNDHYDDNEYDDPGPHTFDPVSAALDRDAARYAWTQTQAAPSGAAQRTKTQIADSEEESDDDDDLDRGIVPDSDSEDEVILLSKPGPSQEILTEDRDEDVTLMAPPNNSHSRHIRSQGEEASKSAPTIPQNQTAHSNSTSNSPPSSPPPLRPSQISTIVPTQSSPRPHLPSQKPANPSSPPTSPPRPFSTAKTRPAPATQALTISSSPLPLPPWSSSGEEVEAKYFPPATKEDPEEARNELDTLVDFSLPPPPPLGGSSSPWR